jgi:ribosomal protein S12 methylthiotransferase RimO
VTLGCARNEVDSEELAARLTAAGWTLTDDTDAADAVMVNTCGFVEAAKRDSIETLLGAADAGRPVIAVGCLAERYGESLASELPEVTVLGFDDYTEISHRLDDVVAGRPLVPHTPRDRRTLLPISPIERPAAQVASRQRLTSDPVAPLKLASGCDRRCAFCAIPTFRGSFVSRHPDDIVEEAHWLADHGARELFLVSENSTSYGKDLGDIRLLESLLPRLGAVPGVDRVRVSYLQPAEMRPSLVEAICAGDPIAPYFDLSFQHSSEPVLRRMRRFGNTESFLELIGSIRRLVPAAGIRSNVIVGFPGETDDDVAELERFLTAARLDAIGVFGYSDEDGTEAAGFTDKLEPAVIAERLSRIDALAEELTTQRAEDRIGETVDVLVESTEAGVVEGRAAHQAPEVDGSVELRSDRRLAIGELVRAKVVGAGGVDLVADVL